jgi:hypothetical protein
VNECHSLEILVLPKATPAHSTTAVPIASTRPTSRRRRSVVSAGVRSLSRESAYRIAAATSAQRMIAAAAARSNPWLGASSRAAAPPVE